MATTQVRDRSINELPLQKYVVPSGLASNLSDFLLLFSLCCPDPGINVAQVLFLVLSFTLRKTLRMLELKHGSR